MSQSEATVQYAQALKAGQKTYRECVLSGRYPYLQILDEILDDSMVAGVVDLGVINIPSDQIVGTKGEGRRTAFAADFMPLLGPDTEFAFKWIELCAAHLSDEGIRDPIRCYEYMGRFYVQEGNKRVSVLKSFGAPSVPGYVTRVIPVYSDDEAVAIYYEFMDFYRLSGVYQVYFSRRGGFAKLQAALGFDPDHVWTEEERRRFQSAFHFFKEAFIKLGGKKLGITVADALLVWLDFYPIGTIKELSVAEISKTLSAIWSDLKAKTQAEPIEVSIDDSAKAPSKGILNRIFGSVFMPNHISVAFINRPDPVHSNWIAGHDLGRRTMEQAMSREVTVRVYNLEPDSDVDAVMEQAVDEGAQVIFATTAPLISACRKLAAKHPEVKVLNCSVAMPYPGVRTYYSRIYEGKFITGAIAGAMTKSDRIGYIASNPIFGVPAGINAFALGAKLTNPRARISPAWSCVSEDPISELLGRGVDLISNRDIPTPQQPQAARASARLSRAVCSAPSPPLLGLGQLLHPARLLHPPRRLGGARLQEQRQGRQLLVGHAQRHRRPQAHGRPARRRAQPRNISARALLTVPSPFSTGNTALRTAPSRATATAGSVPRTCCTWTGSATAWTGASSYDQLLPMARSIVRLQGVYRDALPPEKEEVKL
ncbi:MAG: BMP family ABC transporter substrate-binding protein [Oscillospiraceae bacterium]